MNDVSDIISASRIRWTMLTSAQIVRVLEDACVYGDRDLVRRARRALARRENSSMQLEPVKGTGSTWGARDPHGGVWWPMDDVAGRVTRANVCGLARRAPHVGRWHF